MGGLIEITKIIRKNEQLLNRNKSISKILWKTRVMSLILDPSHCIDDVNRAAKMFRLSNNEAVCSHTYCRRGFDNKC